ncbi:hypothetical protein OUZ56_010678 [Daphnia magna]|uniref:Uncharacterized protein n=1 Tax=Daphnia magna TaxID=35525 RepID=A0ABR0AJC1_9CRUS|nr:hypothetical protein OUZ56_010678 [Daphnia magna]
MRRYMWRQASKFIDTTLLDRIAFCAKRQRASESRRPNCSPCLNRVTSEKSDTAAGRLKRSLGRGRPGST